MGFIIMGLYSMGFISLILSPFTGVTIVSAAAFFIIAFILNVIYTDSI